MYLNSSSIKAKLLKYLLLLQTVFFGGEHTSTTRFGTVDGAFLSGVKGALWVTDQLWQVKFCLSII